MIAENIQTIMLNRIVILLYFLFTFLFGSCSAFLEVGVSSYLQETVNHLPETGRTLVRPWSVTSRNGFFDTTSSDREIFHNRFVTPEPGIYFVALNLLIANATKGFLKPSLVINAEFEETNGITGVHGNTTLVGTVSLSGFLRLFENDELALYLIGSKGSLLRDSTFSIMHMSRLGSVPGFHGVLSHNHVIQPRVKTRLENWRTSGTKGLFMMHSGISPSVGLFCAILQGIHKFTSNINVESNYQLTHCIFSIVLNSNITLLEKYSAGGKKYSMSLSGLFYLGRGDCVELQIEPKSTGVLTVLSESSFSGLFIGISNDISSRFSVSIHRDEKINSIGWNRVENWTISGAGRNFQSEELVLTANNSTFISNQDGLFLVTVAININVSQSLSRSSVYLLVAVKDAPTTLTGNSGLYAGKILLSGPDSLSASGVVGLKKGDALAVYLHLAFHDMATTTGLFCVSLISYDWPGVAATLKDNAPLTSTGWTRVTSWKTQSVPGLFSFDNAFLPAQGIYRTHVDGTYFLSCNVIFNGYPRGNLSVIIAIDDAIDTGGGLFSVNENPKRYIMLNVAGSIRLKKNQNISVYVATTEPASWKISMETGLFVALVGAESLSTPGFFAVKEDEESPSCPPGDIVKWTTITSPLDTPLPNNAHFNQTSGKFKAKEDGVYLVTANILIRHSNSSQITMAILLDGQNARQVMKSIYRSSSTMAHHVSTLTIAGTVRLIAEQSLSIYLDVRCQSISVKVLKNSSFSVVLISRWESDYAAGFLLDTSRDKNGLTTFQPVSQDWNNPLFSKNLTVQTFGIVEIRSSGLYFLQSLLLLNDLNGNKTFHSGICVNSNGNTYNIAFNGIYASKVGEIQGPFVMNAFGVLYLRKGQKFFLCSRTEAQNPNFRTMNGSWFSMARFLPPGQQPGLNQILHPIRNSSLPCDKSLVGFVSTDGNELAYVQSNMLKPNWTSCDRGDFTATLTGSYLITFIFTLRGTPQNNFSACIGPEKCSKCYVDVFGSLRQLNNTFGFVGLVDFNKNEVISVCFKSQDPTLSLVTASRSVQFLSGLELNRTVQLKHQSISFSSGGWHELTEWKSNSGKPVQKVFVIQSGLYVLCINLKMKVTIDGLIGLKLVITGLSKPDVLSILSTSEAGLYVSLYAAVLTRLEASEAIAVSLYSNPSVLNVGNNSTFSAALITKDIAHPCLLLRSKTSKYRSGEWWQSIEQWENLDAQCLSPNSNVDKGTFVTDEAGVYFVTTVVMVRISNASKEARTVELLLSVNGHTAVGKGLRATKEVPDGSPVVLSLSATVFLEPWQTLYVMIRSTGAGFLEVVNGSTFSVALIAETKYYKTLAKNVTRFDNGPRVIRQPPPSVSFGEDLGMSVSWTCDAVAKGAVSYKWLKNDKTITSSNHLSVSNISASDAGRYVCLAEYDSIKVYSQAAELEVFDTSPTFEIRELTSPEDRNVSLKLTIRALDKQRRPANVSVMIVEGNANSTFVLLRSEPKGSVFLTNQIPLDYETKKMYFLKLVATNMDTKKTTAANITVTITDVNDNPPIFVSRSDTSVKEDVGSGSVIFQVKARDADYGNNSIITYSLLPSEFVGEFSLDASSGNITVTGELDREITGELILRIQATDGKFKTNSTLVIYLEDVNDNPPIFISRNNTSVEENVRNGTVIFQVKATDADYGNNSIITYSLLPSEFVGKFSLDASSGNITVTGELDHEITSEVILRIQATDGKFKTNSTLVIYLEDVNDNSPHFNTSRYSITVPENIPIGYLILTVTAEDKDSGTNGLVTYSLVEEPNDSDAVVNEIFSVIATSGVITSLKKMNLNASRVKYEFRVRAADQGNPSLESFANVVITVVDTNDSPPVFTECTDVTLNVRPEAGTELFHVLASDADYGLNANITYLINVEFCSSWFYIRLDGSVYSQEALPWNSNCNITITATDGVHSAFCVVTLRIIKPSGKESQEGGLPDKVIIPVVVISVLLFLVLLLLLIWYCRLRKALKDSYSVNGSSEPPLSLQPLKPRV